MKVFASNDFTGIWPVGTAAVIVAENIEQAEALLTEELKKIKLVFDGTLKEVDLTEPAVIVLRDGNY